MKKALKVALLGAAALMVTLTSCQKKPTINLWSFTDEVPKMVDKYVATHPDFKYKINTTIIATTDGAYQPALDQALQNGGKDQPDIFTAEGAFVLKYTKGEMQDYAMPYKNLGIDIEKAVKDAQIAQYTIDIGTNTKGEIDGLGYQATGGAFIYRRSVAKKVFGTEDPKEVGAILGGGTQSWDKFWAAAEKVAAAGCAMVSGDGDIWHAYENASDKGWIVDGKLYIDPKREAFIDASKKLTDEGLSNGTQDWQDAWFADMAGTGAKPVLGFFGPAWLVNYSMHDNCGGTQPGEGTYGDWAVCESPIGFFWGGTWVLANKNADEEKLDAIRQIIEYITLDTSETGLQYEWANGTFDPNKSTKDCVGSGTVMAKSNGEVAFLGGQNMFDVFVPANQNANGKTLTPYDESINQIWRDQVRAYAGGNKTREEAIATFKQTVKDQLGIDY